MPTHSQLQTLLDLSQARLDDAARQLGQFLASEQADEQKLGLLMSYRDEYQLRFREAARCGMGRDEFNNFSSFLARLDEAIAQQHAAVANARQRTALGQQAWVDQRTQAKAFGTLSQRHKQRTMALESKREQRLSDEHATKRFLSDAAPD
jgi:flagellar FliJ protein